MILCGGTEGGRAVHRHHLHLVALLRRLLLEELRKRVSASALGDVDDLAGVVIADDGEVLVRMPVADFVDSDSIQILEPARVDQRIDCPRDDGGDRPPCTAHQGRHRGPIGAGDQPQHHVLEVACMPCCRARPRKCPRSGRRRSGTRSVGSDTSTTPCGGRSRDGASARRVVVGSGARVAAWALHTACCEPDGDLDGVVGDRHIRHRCTGDLKQTVKCSTDAHVQRSSGLRLV